MNFIKQKTKAPKKLKNLGYRGFRVETSKQVVDALYEYGDKIAEAVLDNGVSYASIANTINDEDIFAEEMIKGFGSKPKSMRKPIVRANHVEKYLLIMNKIDKLDKTPRKKFVKLSSEENKALRRLLKEDENSILRRLKNDESHGSIAKDYPNATDYWIRLVDNDEL